MKHILKCIKKTDWIFVALSVGLIVLQVWLDLKMPEYTKNLTSALYSSNLKMKTVWINGGKMLVCTISSLGACFVCSYIIAKVSSGMAKNLRFNLYNKISSFSCNEMKDFSTSSLITRTTNDVTQIQMFIAMGSQLLIKSPILAIWAISKISNSSMEWTWATIITVAIIVSVVSLLLCLCIPKFKKMQKLIDNLNKSTRENLSGVRVVRAFNAEDYQQDKFSKANHDLTNTQLYTSRRMGLMNPMMTICMNGLTLAIYWIGAYLMKQINMGGELQILKRSIVLGNMTAFTQYAMYVVSAFMMLILIFSFLPRAIVSFRRIKEVLNTSLSITDGNNFKSKETNAIIEFKNVSFGYGEDKTVISDISFNIEKGETVAFIGSTGSGKTTIIDLIPRYYDVDEGEILINGVNVKDFPLKELLNKLALVPQKAVLFKGDIKYNVAYGSTSQNEEEIINALKIAEANFVFELEKGIDSEVAQNGTNFSGGQKQRLSIARAIYKDSDIIIFDDSFSALDYKTDAKVRKNLKTNLKDKTILIVAQRIGTIMNADKIIVLDQGKIVGIGKHKELLQNCSVYKEIALSQLSKEEL